MDTAWGKGERADHCMGHLPERTRGGRRRASREDVDCSQLLPKPSPRRGRRIPATNRGREYIAQVSGSLRPCISTSKEFDTFATGFKTGLNRVLQNRNDRYWSMFDKVARHLHIYLYVTMIFMTVHLYI